MGYLDELPEEKLYTPPKYQRYQAKDNAEAWNNDRKETPEEGENI